MNLNAKYSNYFLYMRTLKWLRKIYINRYSPSLRIWRLNDVKVLSVFSHVLVFWYFSVFYELWMNGWIDSTLHFLSFIVKQSQKKHSFIFLYACKWIYRFNRFKERGNEYNCKHVFILCVTKSFFSLLYSDMTRFTFPVYTHYFKIFQYLICVSTTKIKINCKYGILVQYVLLY